MGQRDYRKYRYRCQSIDQRSGLRCRKQVKRAGGKFCSRACATAARPQGTSQTVSASTARRARAREAARARLVEAIQLAADEMSRVPIQAALMIALKARDEGYVLGYTAGHQKKQFQGHKLRLETSRAALDVFLGSRFGKSFITGNLKPEDLANFSFGGKR